MSSPNKTLIKSQLYKFTVNKNKPHWIHRLDFWMLTAESYLQTFSHLLLILII